VLGPEIEKLKGLLQYQQRAVAALARLAAAVCAAAAPATPALLGRLGDLLDLLSLLDTLKVRAMPFPVFFFFSFFFLPEHEGLPQQRLFLLQARVWISQALDAAGRGGVQSDAASVLGQPVQHHAQSQDGAAQSAQRGGVVAADDSSLRRTRCRHQIRFAQRTLFVAPCHPVRHVLARRRTLQRLLA
jgi:hypothetical protein